ncbi:hypothetical protein TKK_0012222 [Trichogramma kaykai]|uniref:Uncharacterized protein n=1 Tax=Trichogramma kaykai TaxID=54128 RepID=A0ABD2WN55_9HYME
MQNAPAIDGVCTPPENPDRPIIDPNADLMENIFHRQEVVDQQFFNNVGNHDDDEYVEKEEQMANAVQEEPPSANDSDEDSPAQEPDDLVPEQ